MLRVPVRNLFMPRLCSMRPAVRLPSRSLQRSYSAHGLFFRPDPDQKVSSGDKTWIFLLFLLPFTFYNTYDTHYLRNELMQTLHQQQKLIGNLQHQLYIIAALVHIQRVDCDAYIDAQLDTCAGALAYLEQLFPYCFLEENTQRTRVTKMIFHDLAQFAVGVTEAEEVQEEKLDLTRLRETMHTLVRNAAQEVHKVISESKGARPFDTAVRVMDICNKAFITLVMTWEQVEALRSPVDSRVSRSRILG